MILQKNNNKKNNRIFTFIILILIGIALFYYLNKMNKLNKVKVSLNNADHMIKMYQVDYLIDVREQDEYETRHYPGALNVPLSLLKNNLSLKDVPNLKNIHAESKILLYCNSGIRARNAAYILLNQRYEKVKYINDDINKLSKIK